MTRHATATRDLLLAFLSGGVLTFMILANSQLALHGTALFSSWTAHATGTLAALVALALLPRAERDEATGRPPLWAYLGGFAGAVTVMLSSLAANTALALSGTLALGLLGQAGFGLAADRWGLFGLPRRSATARDLGALGLILAGSLLIVFAA